MRCIVKMWPEVGIKYTLRKWMFWNNCTCSLGRSYKRIWWDGICRGMLVMLGYDLRQCVLKDIGIPKGVGNFRNVSLNSWTLKRGETVEFVNIGEGRQYQVTVPGHPLLPSTKPCVLSAGKRARAFFPRSAFHKRLSNTLIYVMTQYVVTFYIDIWNWKNVFALIVYILIFLIEWSTVNN